jgi:FAD/FMN-containing dehydrogenase
MAASLPFRAGRAAGGARATVPVDTDSLTWTTGQAASIDQRAFNLRTLKTPQYRALCLTEDGVQRAVGWAQDNGVPFSVMSGGHCFEGLSQSEGLVIDLGRMNEARLAGVDTLIAGPGATLAEVNSLTAVTGRALPAGYCQTVRLGGHVGGGGLGILSRAYGLASDHLLSARVVTASGLVVTASADQNADLFWALRGGGSGSFGVVTQSRFRLRTVPQATLIQMHWNLPTAQCAAFLADWQDLNLRLDRRVASYLYVASLSAGVIQMRSRLISVAPHQVSVDIAKRHYAIARPARDPVVLQSTFEAVADRMWPKAFYPQEHAKIGSSFLTGAAGAGTWERVVTALDRDAAFGQRMTLETLGGAVDDVAPSDTAFVHRGDAAFLAQFDMPTPKGTDTAERIAAMRKVQGLLADGRDAGAYVNYPDLDLPNWSQAYWGANYARLAKIKTAYDPSDVFRHAQSIRPLT